VLTEMCSLSEATAQLQVAGAVIWKFDWKEALGMVWLTALISTLHAPGLVLWRMCWMRG